MLPNKITKKFKEISKFFVENFDISANAIFTVLDKLKLNDKNFCFSINYNAKYNLVKLLSLIYSDGKSILGLDFYCMANPSKRATTVLQRHRRIGIT